MSDNRYPYRQRIALKVLASLGSELDSKQVVQLLKSADSNVREEARRLISSRSEMRKEIIKIFSNIVKEEEQELSDEELIEGIIIAYAQDSDFQDILLNILNDKEIKTEIKIQVLSSLSFLDRFPDPLQLAILIGLNHFEPDVRMEALNIARRFNIKENILSKIKIIGQDLDKSQKERASAIQVLVRHQGRLSSDLFFFLVDLLEKKQNQIILRRQAAQSLGSLHLHLLTDGPVSYTHLTLPTKA